MQPTEAKLIPFSEAVRQEPSIDVLRPLDLMDFLQRDFPPRDHLLAPWLPRKGLAMVYAKRGVGKTHFSLSVGLAVASGGAFLKWQAPRPARVLYLDGEMPAGEMQRRLASMLLGMEIEPRPGHFQLASADLYEAGLPDLATEEGQRALAPMLEPAELIIVDNIATLIRSGAENETEAWRPVQDWALAMRRQGKSVLFVHHAGKGGQQRGSSGREDVLDTVVNLRHPTDYAPQQGALFEVHFEKSRGFQGDDAAPVEAKLEEIDGAAVWTTRSLDDVRLQQVADLAKGGMTVRRIGETLGMSPTTVQRLKEKARGRGMLDE